MIFGGEASCGLLALGWAGFGDETLVGDVVFGGEASFGLRALGWARLLVSESSGALYTVAGVRSRFALSEDGTFMGEGTLSCEAALSSTEGPRLP